MWNTNADKVQGNQKMMFVPSLDSPGDFSREAQGRVPPWEEQALPTRLQPRWTAWCHV